MRNRTEPTLADVLQELHSLRRDLRVLNKSLLTVPEAAEFLGIAPKTIRNGLGPRAAKPFAVKPVRLGGRVLFRRVDLERLVDGLGSGK